VVLKPIIDNVCCVLFDDGVFIKTHFFIFKYASRVQNYFMGDIMESYDIFKILLLGVSAD